MTHSKPSPSPDHLDIAQPDTLVSWARVDRFLGQLTHDIRNGLNSLELQLTFLGEISTDPDAVSEIAQLRSTVAGIGRQLQAVKVKSGPVSPHLMEYPAGDFLEDLRERFDRLHPAEAARVVWEANSSTCVLQLDPELAISALLELLANGLEFGAAGSEISLTGQVDAGTSSYALCLTQRLAHTPNVPPETWGKQPLLSTKRGAYGLGLFRARRIFEAQTIRMELTCSENNVLTVAILIPLAANLDA